MGFIASGLLLGWTLLLAFAVSFPPVRWYPTNLPAHNPEILVAVPLSPTVLYAATWEQGIIVAPTTAQRDYPQYRRHNVAVGVG